MAERLRTLAERPKLRQDELLGNSSTVEHRTSDSENLGSNPSSPASASAKTLKIQRLFGPFFADRPKVATMLPQCSHITKKRGVFYYRRRLPKPMTGEIALSLRTRKFLQAEWSAHKLDVAFARVLRRMTDEKNSGEISRIVHQYLRDHLNNDLERRVAASHSPVYGSADIGEDPVAADLEWIDGELDTAKTELTERLYEHQRPLIDYLMQENKLPEEQWAELAFAIFRANVTKWEVIRKRTLGDLEEDACVPGSGGN